MSIDYAELLNCKVCIISVFGSENLSMANIRKNNSFTLLSEYKITMQVPSLYKIFFNIHFSNRYFSSIFAIYH